MQLQDLQLPAIRRVEYTKWGNKNPYIEEEQTTPWPKEKAQTGKHTYKTKDRVTRTPLKTGDERRCSWKGNQLT
jgi:hypothetical protein